MVSRFRQRIGQKADGKQFASEEHHEHPLLGLGDGGRGFAGVPSNPLELAVLHGNDHEANEAAMASNAELAAAIRRRNRLAEQLLSAHTQVNFDLTPTDSPLEAKRKRLRAKRKRERRQAKLRAVESRREAYEMDEELPKSAVPARSESAPIRPEAVGSAIPDDLPVMEPAPGLTVQRANTVVPRAARADRDIPDSSTKAIRASRNSHLLRIAKT